MKAVSIIAKKMILYSHWNLQNINYFMRIYAYAKLFGETEELGKDTQKTLDIAAVIYDIACPLCLYKYGNPDGKRQEMERIILVEEFLRGAEILEEMKKRIVYLVDHYHIYTNVDGKDNQILLEADYLVNEDKSSYSKKNIQYFMDKIFRTKTEKRITKIYISY